MGWLNQLKKCYKQYGCWDKSGIAKAIQDGIQQWLEDNAGGLPQTFQGELQGFIPNNVGVLAGVGNFGSFSWDPVAYPYNPSNIQPIDALNNPACGPDGTGFGTLVIDPNLPNTSDGTFDISFIIEDNSAGLGGLFLFCVNTGEIGQRRSIDNGGGVGTNTGPTSHTVSFDASSLSCPLEQVRVGIYAWGAQSGIAPGSNCDEITPDVDTITVVTPSECAASEACFEELFGCSFATMLSLNIDTVECPVLHAYGAIGGDTAQFGDRCGVTVEKIGTGLWQVTFDEPYPTPTYPVLFGSLNDGTARDGTIIEVVNGTQNANGFQIMAMTGDNGAGADILVDHWVSFAVPGKKQFAVLNPG